MSNIDDQTQPNHALAVQQLLKSIKREKNLRWRVFASQIGFDEEDVKAIAYGKKKPWSDFVMKLTRCCERRNYAIPTTIAAQLGMPLETKVDSQLQESLEYSFISALGINTTIRESSIENYQGTYLHFTLDDDAKAITSTVALSREIGADQTPIYRSWRRIPGFGRRRYFGAYFANDKNLYLVGTPLGSVDIRLNIFSILPGENQNLLRGVVLGFSHRGAILGSRCVLLKARNVSAVQRKNLTSGPLSRDALQKELMVSKAPIQKELLEIVGFLFDLSNATHIKLLTGE